MNEHLPSSQDATAEPEGKHRPLIETGWVVAGRLDAADQEAIGQARQCVLAYLRKCLPGYEWEMPLLRREEIGEGVRQEPVVLLEHGVEDRGVRRWDFVIVVAGADLVSHYKPYAWAAVSRSLEALVISTSRVDPLASGDDSPRRVEQMARRIAALALHGLGDLFGAAHDDDPQSYLAEFPGVEDLDRADRYSGEQLERMRQSLDEVADRRLEEQARYRGAHRLKFYAHAAWINRGEIADALVQARPWEFPFRLTRLTTAAVSASLILAVTAEAWELGMSQSGPFATLLSIVTIAVTTAYLLARQQLLLRRERARLSEQRVVTNLSTFLVVLAGMTASYVFLALGVLVVSLVFFSPQLVQNWAASEANPIGAGDYAVFVAFVASLGLLIGALGASFESQDYFRHITYVDEEI